MSNRLVAVLVVLASIICSAVERAQAQPQPSAKGSVKLSVTDPETLAKLFLAPEGPYRSVVAIAGVPRGKEPAAGSSAWRMHFRCGGVVVAPNWVLTMGYCTSQFDSSKPISLHVLFGSNDLLKTRTMSVEEVRLQAVGNEREGISGNKRVALLRLKEPLPVPAMAIARKPLTPDLARAAGGTDRPAPIDDAGGSGTVVGWGHMAEDQISRSVESIQLLQHLTVKSISRAACNVPALYNGEVAALEFCAASVFEGVDVCTGFGGAPLLTFDELGRSYVVGLVNYGIGCGRKDKPHVYADVGGQIAWIEQNTAALPLRPAYSASQYGFNRSVPADGGARVGDGSNPFTLSTKQGEVPLSSEARERLADRRPNIVPRFGHRYMVSIGDAGRNQMEGHRCGGLLITRKHVLTAAHCVRALEATPKAIQVKIDSGVLSSGGIIIKPQRIIPHPEYRPAVKTPAPQPPANDVAILELEELAPSDIPELRLAHPQTEAVLMGAAETGQVIGWGQSAFTAAARRSDLLLHTTVRLVERQKCEQSHSGIDPATMMCAGDELADACLGDSGGPLLMTDQNLDYFLVGLVSWGDGCARRDKPGVYVRVSHYFGWIQANLNK